ncbi:unnamed protein product [Cuscuta campestris]|uniref:Uncharacterized protein n=1 Tax=Cuscuta campestris TaxID=132261 RepID=A0A484MDX9_9ASTE|nr:unnamed protein product [Cuscuta campestris]
MIQLNRCSGVIFKKKSCFALVLSKSRAIKHSSSVSPGVSFMASKSSRAKLDDLEAFLVKGGYSEFKLRRLRKNDILFLFKREGDYLRWFSRQRWIVNGISIVISKWSPDYSPTRESPIAPVWIKLEHFPVHLNDHGVLFKVASLFGKPIKVDSNTAIGVFLEQSRFCVERDTSLPFPSRLHFRLGSRDLWIPCKFENPPHFCSCCNIFGHTVNNCRKQKHLSLTGKAPAGEADIMGAGLKEDLAGWTWVKGKRHGRPDSILGRVGVHVGQRNSPPKSQVQKQVDISNTGVPFSLAPLEFHTTSDQPCSSKQANSQWSPILPIIEDVNEDEVLSTSSPKQNAPLPITIPDDSLALVPYSNGPGVPTLAPHLQDDYWVCKPSSASTMCMDFEKLEKEDEFSSCTAILQAMKGICLSMVLSFFPYRAHTVIERRQLWESLQGRSNTNQNWVVGGDFNAISSPSEYKGQCEPNALGMEEFNSCIEACNLFCPDPSGGLFTGLAQEAVGEHGFLQVVKDCWTKTPYSGGMRGLVAKLKGLKGCLKEWNKKEFGNIFENLTKAEEFATQNQLCFEEDPTDANREKA